MQLIYAKAVTFDELPYIEAAFFTVAEVKSHYRETFSYIHNLGQMLADCGRPGVVCGKYECLEWQLERLIKRIENYQVVLVMDRYGHPPLRPPFKWQLDETHAQGGTWRVAASRYNTSYAQLEQLKWLLRDVRPSYASLAQAARVAALAAAGAAVVKAVTEEKRYPLMVALGYDFTPTVRADKAVSARFKWENEMTGPETRRSGEIKKTDPVYSDLHRRELRAGDYRLEFQNATLDTRAIKQPRK